MKQVICMHRESPELACAQRLVYNMLKKNRNIILVVLAILNIVIAICCISLYNENIVLKNNHTQILQNISGGNANWKLIEAFEVVDDFTVYINLGYLEYVESETRNLSYIKATLLKDSSDGKVIFTSESQYGRNLYTGDKLPLGSYRGKPFKSDNLEDQKLFLKIIYNVDNIEYIETFMITGEYFELPFNETSNGNYILGN